MWTEKILRPTANFAFVSASSRLKRRNQLKQDEALACKAPPSGQRGRQQANAAMR